jgi:hypothetical protein
LRAQKYVVLPDEDAAEFAALEAALTEELAPAGVLQSVLVQRIAAAAWRLSRAERLETELFAENGLPDGTLGLALIRDGNRAGAFGTLLRYRGGALAEFWRALRTLKALQAEGAAIPARAASHAGNAIPRPAAAAAPAARPNEPNRRGVAAESAAVRLQQDPDKPDPAPSPPRPDPVSQLVEDAVRRPPAGTAPHGSAALLAGRGSEPAPPSPSKQPGPHGPGWPAAFSGA